MKKWQIKGISRQVANDAFINEIVHVLPYIGALFTPPITGEEATVKVLKEDKKKYSKTALLKKGGILGQYLDLIKLIAKGKAENTFDVELDNMNENEILQVFVCAEKSAKIAQLQEDVANQWKIMEDIFHSAANTMSPRFEKLLTQMPRDISNESDDEEVDNE